MQLNISFFSRRGYRVRLTWPNIWGHNLVSSPNAGMHMGSVASLRSCGHRRHCRTNGWLISCRIILWSSQKGVITPDLLLLPCNVCPLRQRVSHEEWVNLMITPFSTPNTYVGSTPKRFREFHGFFRLCHGAFVGTHNVAWSLASTT